jgi:hypothetical protein
MITYAYDPGKTGAIERLQELDLKVQSLRSKFIS